MNLLETDSTLQIVEKGKIPSPYHGYLASFGPCLVQAGLLQTVAFYSKDGDDKNKVLHLMKKTLEDSNYLEKNKAKNLHDYLCNKYNGMDRYEYLHIKEIIMDACIACKLALKTYPKKDEKK